MAPITMHRNVEILIGRLATDLGLQRRFIERPEGVLHELGLELTAVEFEALTALDPQALLTFSLHLDPRIRKVPFEPKGR